MREKEIEQYFVKKVKAAGGRAYKFVSPGNAGVPDRLVLFPYGQVFFVELKAPGCKQTDLQKAQAEKIRQMGHEVLVLDSKEAVDSFFKFSEVPKR